MDVVVGKAGAGKTYALDTARAAWQAGGYTVLGCALAARAAAELEAGAGIDSYTIDGLLGDLERRGPARWLGSRTVIVVDEAAMVGTRKLARLLDHAETARAEVVLVGDHHQLPEIDAGGLFRGLADRLDTIELVDNHRQHESWERDALDELRNGEPRTALAAYAVHDRIVLAETADAVRDRLVGDWWTASRRKADPMMAMIAARRSDVDDLNQRARARMRASGLLHGEELVTKDDVVFQAGDRVLALRNDRRVGVVNGTRGRLLSIDGEQGDVVVRTDDGRTLRLPGEYVDAGHLTHGYAMTAHKAQGVTVDRAFVLGSEAIYREWGYVAMSRARRDTRLYLVDHRAAGRQAGHGVLDCRDDPLVALSERLQRSGAQRLARDHGQSTVEILQHDGVSTEELRKRLLATMPHSMDHKRAVIDEQIRQAHERIRGLEEQIAVNEQKLAVLQRGAARLTRRDQISQVTGTLGWQCGDLTAWRQQVERLEAERVDLDQADRQREQWAQEHAGDLTAYADGIRHAEAAARRQATLREVTTAPEARPNNPTDRSRWRRELIDPSRNRNRSRAHEYSLDIDIA